MRNPFRYFNSSPEVIRLVVTMYESHHKSSPPPIASVHNHFNHDRHVNRRDIFKQNRAAALAEWRQLAA